MEKREIFPFIDFPYIFRLSISKLTTINFKIIILYYFQRTATLIRNRWLRQNHSMNQNRPAPTSHVYLLVFLRGGLQHDSKSIYSHQRTRSLSQNHLPSQKALINQIKPHKNLYVVDKNYLLHSEQGLTLTLLTVKQLARRQLTQISLSKQINQN